ncbi:MAG: hypothetical protein Greene041619_511 [Candidatus Peregrinibacteria bacterium Greene0416_19]|nr:MAG: hypothetical protein Greene041619_511 [Candidatus Peregrinibacteria bacterium Greene0416_19]
MPCFCLPALKNGTIMPSMDFDPHTLQQIIQRIYQQMRCPQCGKRVPVDFASVRVAANDFMLLQLKCDTCDAYIVLHATLQGAELLGVSVDPSQTMINASSNLSLKDSEVELLRQGLEQCGGSFEQLFKKFGPGNEPTEITGDTRLA